MVIEGELMQALTNWPSYQGKKEIETLPKAMFDKTQELISTKDIAWKEEELKLGKKEFNQDV